MERRFRKVILLLVSVLAITYTHSLHALQSADATLEEDYRFFKLPEMDRIIGLNFETQHYIIKRILKPCDYANFGSGSFTMSADSIITLDGWDKTHPMIIAINDGTGTKGIVVEGYWANENHPMQLCSYGIEFTNGGRHFGAINTVRFIQSKSYIGPYDEPVEPNHIVLYLHQNLKHIGGITLDLSGLVEKENSWPYYPIYKLQNKPINKLIIYADPNFGITSSRFKIENDSLFLLTQHSQRKLKELDSNYVCEDELADMCSFVDHIYQYIQAHPSIKITESRNDQDK